MSSQPSGNDPLQQIKLGLIATDYAARLKKETVAPLQGAKSPLAAQVARIADLAVSGKDVTPDLILGGGMQYAAMDYASTSNLVTVPEYWKFDAMVNYKLTREASLQLNVYNITDALYYAQYYAGQAVPASGRWASLSLRVRLN